MNEAIFAGSGLPLQRVLHGVLPAGRLPIAGVWCDLGRDDEVLRLCRDAGIEPADISQLGQAPAAAGLPAHDWLFCVNSTVIFPHEVLDGPAQGAFNMHPGRLPDYAGLHTHQWAIRNGETGFASTVHWMAEQVDAGAVAYDETIEVTANETGISLFLKCLKAGARLVERVVDDIVEGRPIPSHAQDLGRRRLYTHAEALDGRLQWTWSALDIERFVRAADYRPFVSPTYVPETSIAGRAVVVSKAEAVVAPAAGDLGSPGTVLAVTDDGATVCAGDGRAVLVKKVRDAGQGGGPLSLGEAGFAVGARLATGTESETGERTP